MPETIGHYKILDRIGSGGIGDVFRARDTKVGRTVALKVVAPDITADPERRAQFLSDAKRLTALTSTRSLRIRAWCISRWSLCRANH